MFGLPLNVIIIAIAVGFVAMLFAVVIFFPKLSNEKQADTRLKNIRANSAARNTRNPERNRAEEATKRRKNVQDTLNEIEEKNNKGKRLSLSLRLHQAGLSMSKTTFIVFSIIAGAVMLGLGFIFHGNPLIAAGLALVGGFGFPRFVLSFLTKRRQKAFLAELPDAVDIVVRGIKAGLPLNDGLRMVAAEAKEPLATEFREVVEAQQLGVPMSEAIHRLYENMPLPETSFLSTVISIQQTSGGSLSEALGNLSKILRERKKMRAKIKAISSEAKASAGIIGSLPIVVGGVVYVISPDYIGRLFESSTGHFILMVGAGMMMTGIGVMRKMINFEI